jgi:hypothetical protein
MEHMGAWARRRNESLIYYIEDGNAFAGELRHFLNQIKNDPELKARFAMAGADTYTKKDAIQLQAADLLAWEFTTYCKEPNGAPLRPSMETLQPLHVTGISVVGAQTKGMIHRFRNLKSNRTRF